MKKIAIIGGGIIGMTLANYLDPQKFDITVYDEGLGQATKASAGIISPWLSKRRNKKWYQLAREGAALFPKLVKDFQLTEDIYRQSGTVILRPAAALADLAHLAEERKQTAPEIGEITMLSAVQTAKFLPLLKETPSLFISGGGRLDGPAYLNHLQKRAETKGVTFCSQRAHFRQLNQGWEIVTNSEKKSVDFLALTPGPHLKELLATLNLSVDIRPQKGQLLVFETPFTNSQQWPVAMLDGEADLIPFNQGKILLGATHENEQAWDLEETVSAFQQLTSGTAPFLKEAEQLFKQPMHYRVGTRAYTSDFAPFFGPLPEMPHLVVASGLGSSGLTTGPFIGYQLAEYFNTGVFKGELYQKPLSQYVKNNPSL